MCVGFLYKVVMRELSGYGITKVSKAGMGPSALVSSVVNWMCIIKNKIPDNNIVRNNIFLGPEDAMLKTWQKLVLNK